MSNIWFDVIIIVAVVLVALILIKWPAGKYFFGSAIFVALLCGAVYCAIQLNFYYSSRGGVLGIITGTQENNQVDVDDFKFDLTNIELVQEDGDEYSANIISKDVLVFDADKTYGVYVNDLPTNLDVYTSSYLIGSYEYVFKSFKQETLCQDTLYFYFTFDSNSTTIKLQTKGGSNAVKYWNNFFNRNKFILTIQEANYSSEGVNFGTGSIGEYYVVKYYNGFEFSKDKVFATQAYKKGIPLMSPGIPQDDGIKTFNGWRDVNDVEYKVGEDVVNKNLELFVKWGELLGYDIEDGVITKSLNVQSTVYVNDTYSLSKSNKAISGSDYSINSIAPGAFRDDKKIKQLYLEGQVSVGANAFYGCSNLQNVMLGNIKDWGTSCFEGCSSLESINFFTFNLNSIPDNCFAFCGLTKVNLPESIANIGSHAFDNCDQLRSIGLGKARYIGAFAFQRCPSLQTVVIKEDQSIVYPNVTYDPFPTWEQITFYIPSKVKSQYEAESKKTPSIAYEPYWNAERFQKIVFYSDR